jgi:hypothetical protein
MKVETIKIEPVDGWKTLYPIILADLKNGDIAFGSGYVLYILNN